MSALADFDPKRSAELDRELAGIDPSAPSTPADLTDLYLAQRLRKALKGRFLYIWPWNSWLAWDGRRWIRDQGDEITRAALEITGAVADELAVAAMRASSAKDATDRTRFGRYAVSRRGIENALALARALDDMTAKPEDFDGEPAMLNTPSGVLDLRTGALHPHDPLQRNMRITAAPMDDAADCPRWLAFLERVIDPSLLPWIQKSLGYSLTGYTNEQCYWLTVGRGRNGKSTLLETVRTVLGDYALDTPFSTFLAHEHGGIPNDLARLRGARFVTASEPPVGQRFNEEALKKFCGGDMLTARFLRQEFFEFRPTAKLWLAANTKPNVGDFSDGFWRRVLLVPFDVQIPDDEVDRDLPEKLAAEAPGILRWLSEGAQFWFADGLDRPQLIRDAVNEYKTETDVLGAFLDDACLVAPDAWCEAGALFEAYRDWCKTNGIDRAAMTQTNFGRALTERGYRRGRAANEGRRVIRRGLTLRANQ